MDDTAADAQKDELDRKLANSSRNAMIAFGPGLFAAFQQRGWFTLEKFEGTAPSEPKYPAYAGTHFVFPSSDVPDLDFRVRRDV